MDTRKPDPEKPLVLVVDDEQGIRDLVTDILEGSGHTVVAAANGREAMTRLEARGFDLMVSDVRMPVMDGIELLEHVKERWPGLPVIMLSAFGTIPQAVQAMRNGAFDFLEKPIQSPKALRGIVRRAIESAREDAAAREGDPPPFLGDSAAMASVREIVERVATRDTTVLVLGESGTGKEVAARYLHARSRRSGATFVAVNTAAIPATMLEDELFGHEKGAFTGADRERIGVFEAADGGTLFLDEIGDMSPDLQSRMLRIIETQAFTRLGGTRQIDVDVRLIAATNRDLAREVKEGRFREDLYYRLSVFPVRMPPLRERTDDILPLAMHFAAEIASRAGQPAPGISEGATRRLLAHSWPGNVRELKNVIERAMIMVKGPSIECDAVVIDETDGHVDKPASTTLKEMEKSAVLRALEQSGGNRKSAAEALGISLRSLQYKIKEYGLKRR